MVNYEMFRTTNEDDIVRGRATDAYFLRTEETLTELDENPLVTAEITADQFQDDTYEVLSGVQQVVELFDEANLDTTIEALPEGALFNGGPVMRLTGPYKEFARYETSLLGFLSHASGIATAAYRTKRAAGASGPSVLSFGARHVHPSIAPLIEHNALLAGLNGFSHVAAGDEIGEEPSGTMPHALMLSLGKDSQEQAWNGFNDAVDETVPRIALCDTFTDEKDEVIRAAEALGDDLDGVRLDTTGSRRGDFEHIIKEVNWALAEIEREDVDIYVSGGLTPSDVEELRPYVNGVGVGSYIACADPVDFSLDIVSVDGEPIAKRGKNSGIKDVYRTDSEHVVAHRESGQLLNPTSTASIENANPEMETVFTGEPTVAFDRTRAMKRLYSDAAYYGEMSVISAEEIVSEHDETLTSGDIETGVQYTTR